MKLLKKVSTVILLSILTILIITATCPAAFAVVITDGDYEFSFDDDGNCLVYSYLGSDNEIVLPDTVYGRAVIGVDDNCFANSDISSVTFPDSYTAIGDSAFYNCKNIQAVTLPKSLSFLGVLAFAKCDALQSVNISVCNSLKTISYSAFFEAKSLKSINLPQSIETIGESAFSDSGLESINIPDGVTTICARAFMNCNALSEVSFSDNITEIQEYAFYNCALQNVVLPPKTATLGDYAFSKCNLLSIVDIPISLKTIGEKCFYNDTSLKNLFIPDTVTSMGANCLAPMSYNKTIKVTCYENSYAAEYCYDNMVLDLVTIEKKMGDVNLDGTVDILDVTYIQWYKIGRDTIPTYRAKELADVNKDGIITIRDATLIQMYLAKIITEF